MEHPKDVGDRSTLAVMVALREAGYEIAVPFGDNTRYDLVIDDGRRLTRVQCKTGRLRHGGIRFKTASSYAHHISAKEKSRHYQGEIDSFAVYCPSNGGVYRIEEVPTVTNAILRVEPPRNGQIRRIRLAADYQVGTVRVPSVVVTPALRESSGAR